MTSNSNRVMLIGLVGGFGSRPWPLTGHPGIKAYKEQLEKLKLGPQTYNSNAVPKPLAPLGGVPLMLPLFRRIVEQCEIQEIAMALMYMPEDIRQYFSSNPQRLRGNIMFWEHQRMDPDPRKEINLNTAGCVIRGWQQELKGRGAAENYIIASADIRSNANVARMLEEHKRNNALISIVLASVPWKEVGRFGVVFQRGAFQDDNKRQISGTAGKYALIDRFQEKDPNSKSNLNNASIYIISERLFQLIEDDIRVPQNRNQLDPRTKKRYLDLLDKIAQKHKLTEKEENELKKINPYNLPIPGINGVPDRPYEPERGNYVNDWTGPATGYCFRLGVYSSILRNEGRLQAGKANANYQDWGGHIFPEVAQHHPEIYAAANPSVPHGFYGYTTNSLWADDGTREALLNANHELLLQIGGFQETAPHSFHSFDWWPIPYGKIEFDTAGRKIWFGENVRIEEGAYIIGPAIIGDNVTVKRGSRVQFSVIGDGWTIEKSIVNGSVLWPDRRMMGLSPSVPDLSYLLNGIHLESCIVGGGFNPLANEFSEDQEGHYDINFTLKVGGSGNPSQVTLKSKAIISNSEGTVAVKLERKDLPFKDRVPEIFTQDVIDTTKKTSKILIIEDRLEMLLTYKTILEAEGWESIESATNLDEALEKLESTKYDFVICDSVLHIGDVIDETEGIKILKKVKLNLYDINFKTPFIFWSFYKGETAFKGLTPKQTAKLARLGVIFMDKDQSFARDIPEVILETILKNK